MKHKVKIPAWRRLLLKLLRCQVQYTRSTPRQLSCGPTIVAANHISMLDGILVALASPEPLVFGVEHQYAVDHPQTSKLLQRLSALGLGKVVPVCSSQPMGLRTLLKSLKEGHSVMIFPEGKISIDGTPNEKQPGLEWLARKSGAKVTSIRLKGAEQSRFFGKSGRKIWPKISLIF